MIIILHQTQLPQNLGSVARVMKNFGLERLRLVSPHCAGNDPQAIALSAGAEDILAQTEVYQSLEAAIADLQVAYGTGSTQRELIKEYLTPRGFIQEYTEQFQTHGKSVGVVFGPERTGLDNHAYAICHKIIQIPVNPHFSSLNIAQAVAVIAYEMFINFSTDAFSGDSSSHLGKTQWATHKDVEGVLAKLEPYLDANNFWRVKSKKPIMRQNLYNLFHRQRWTVQDIRTLHGVIDSLTTNSNSEIMEPL